MAWFFERSGLNRFHVNHCHEVLFRFWFIVVEKKLPLTGLDLGKNPLA